LVDDPPSQERIRVKNEELENRRQALVQALSGLNVRERRIFEARRLAEDPIPFGVLADEFGVSGERVRQIEVLAFEKVQIAVQHWVCRH
jgi:RNA polymerase sigma-32 factor